MDRYGRFACVLEDGPQLEMCFIQNARAYSKNGRKSTPILKTTAFPNTSPSSPFHPPVPHSQSPQLVTPYSPKLDLISHWSQFDNKKQLHMGQAEKEKGNTVDMTDVQNGPLTEANRECRDILCCLLFLGCIGGMIYLTIFGYTNGNPYNAFRGVDSSGNQCGIGPTASFPYLYFTNPIYDISVRSCVDGCPSFTSGDITAINSYPSGSAISYDIKYNTDGDQFYPSNSASPTTQATGNDLGYDTTLVVGRLCVPNANMFSKAVSISSSAASTAFSQGDLNNFITDIINNWKWLLAALGWAVVISFFFMFMLRCLAGCIVWCSLFGLIVFFIGLGLLFLYNAGYMGAAASAATYLGVPSINTGSNAVYGWICIGLGCLFFIVVLCCCSRLRLAVAVCKTAGQFVAGVCTSILVPIIQTIIAGGVWAACIVVMVYLVSCSKFTSDSTTYFSSIASYSDDSMIRFYIFVFFTLWVSAFIGAMTIFIIASACAMWYYSHGPDQELTLPVSRSYKMVFRFHFGSLAFGALLLAIVQFLQMMVEIVKRQAEAQGQSNKCFEYIIRCLECFLACVECIVKFINTQAYIQIAIRGKNFCYAAKDGFELAWSNALRYAVVGGVGGVIMFLGKLMIAGLTAGGFYLLITYVSSIRQNYLQPFYQVILAGIFGYVVATLFMAVYTVAMDTLLVCFIVDENNQKAKGKKGAINAPQDLADLMETD